MISAMASHSSKYTEREIRQLDFLSQFDLEFCHARVANNEVADALSRIEIYSLQFPSGIDYTELAAEQKREGIRSHGIPNLITLPFGSTPVWSAIDQQAYRGQLCLFPSEEKFSTICMDLHIRASKPPFA